MQADVAQIDVTRAPDVARTRSGMPRLRTLGDLDGRTAAARRFRELVTDYSSDLGGDLTTAQAAIVQRVVSLQVWCEGAEASYAESGELDISTFTTATNAMRRLLADIGLERRPKDVTPNLREYLASLGPEPGAGESAADVSPETAGAGEATGAAANESEPHTECAGLNGHPAQPAGAAPHDAVAHSADCASVPDSSADGGEHG